MNRDKNCPVLAKSFLDKEIYQSITYSEAGWNYLNFMSRTMKPGQKWFGETGNNEYLFVLVTEGKGDTVAKEANSGEAFLSPWEYDSISFFIDIDNSNDREAFGDFNLWLGFSSAGRKDLYASLSNLPRNISRNYLPNIKVKTSGNQKQNNRIIEAAISWQGISDNIDDLFEPEQNLTKAVRPGLRFGCEPLLVDDSYEKQSFIGGEKRPGGKDKNSVDILLIQ